MKRIVSEMLKVVGHSQALGQRQSSPVGASAFRIQFIELSRSYGD